MAIARFNGRNRRRRTIRKLRIDLLSLKNQLHVCMKERSPFSSTLERAIHLVKNQLDEQTKLKQEAQARARVKKLKQKSDDASRAGSNTTNLLVNATRVSKQWRGMIKHSQLLQQALFLRPLNALAVTYKETGKIGFWSTGRRASQATLVYKNPFLDTVCNLRKAKAGSEEWEILTRRGASWKGMFVSQPPPMAAEHPCAVWDYVNEYFEIVYRNRTTESYHLGNILNEVFGPGGKRRPMYVYPEGWMEWCEVTTGRDVRHVKLPLPGDGRSWEIILKEHGYRSVVSKIQS